MSMDSSGTNEKLRVLAVIPGDESTFDFARNQVACLSALGVEIRCVYLLSRTSPLGLIRSCREVRREIARFCPHIVHSHFGTVTSFVAAISSTTPVVISYKGSDLYVNPELNSVRARLAVLLSQISSLRAKRVICVSRRLRSRLWWRQNRAVVVPDGINLNRFRPQPKEVARQILGWPRSERIVIFNGAKQPRLKGLRLVQRAIKVAEASMGPIRLILLDVPSERMPTCLSAADCLAMASVYEGSPNVLKEALACNLPVVTTDVGDVVERLQNVHPSRVVPRNVHDFGEAIADVLREGRPSNGRDQVHMCDEAYVAKAVCDVLHDVLIRKPNRTPLVSWRPI